MGLESAARRAHTRRGARLQDLSFVSLLFALALHRRACQEPFCCGRFSRSHCLTGSILGTVVGVLSLGAIILFAVAPAVGQAEIRGATLAFEQINITNPRGSLFDMAAAVVLAKLEPLGGDIAGERPGCSVERLTHAAAPSPQWLGGCDGRAVRVDCHAPCGTAFRV